MKQLIERRLKHTQLPDDLVSAALARLPNGIAERWFSRPLIPAAVLIPLIERESELTVLLTQRTEHLKDHPGQISFPGGRCEPVDLDPRHTALRETLEEIGLSEQSIAVAGYLDPLAVVTGFAVAPVVAFVGSDLQLTLDPYEVADTFEVPLEFFLDAANHQQHDRTVRGVTMPFSEYHFEDRRIWGATAMMIYNLTNIINNK